MGFTTLGYGHRLYSQSLNEFGQCHELPYSQGHYLLRSIPGTSFSDGMGAYPLFACETWERLPQDFLNLKGGLVSFSAVVDPFGCSDESHLRDCFPDIVIPFKKHFVVSFDRPLTICRHHLRNSRKAAAKLKIEFTTCPIRWLQEWTNLYDQLIQRHRIGDIRRFSSYAFLTQLQIPGMFALRAQYQGVTVGMVLFLAQKETVYYHLGAYNSEGYRINASFALFSDAINSFREQGYARINLGAGAGMVNSAEDGLSRFKAGWANETRTAYFCGRILDRQAYARVLREKNIGSTSYFPAYRQGEFCKKSA